MTYKQNMRDEAFMLFCQGLSIADISAHFGGRPSEYCLRQWRVKFDWDDLRDEARIKTAKKLLESVADFNAHQFENLEDAIVELLQKLKLTGAESAEGIGKTISELIRTQRLLIGAPTDHVQLSGAALDSVIERELARVAGAAEKGIPPPPTGNGEGSTAEG